MIDPLGSVTNMREKLGLLLGALIGKPARDLGRCQQELAGMGAQYDKYLVLYIRWHEKAIDFEQERNQERSQYRLLRSTCLDVTTRTCDPDGEPISAERIRGALRKALKDG